ncbi:MAG: VOC family protein [Archangium sp.]
MNITHLDLQVSDVPLHTSFFERVFGLKRVTKPGSPAIAILEDDAGFVLVLQKLKEGDHFPDGFHLGFHVADAEAVSRMRDKALSEGVQVSDVIVNARGTTIYCTAPDGFWVEVTARAVKS